MIGRQALGAAAFWATCLVIAEAPAAGAEEIAGVAFAAPARPSMVPEGGAVRLPVNRSVSQLVFLGMTNSLDQGSPGWGAAVGERDKRFFLGTQIGEVVVGRPGGTSESLPLTFGYNVWWWAGFERDGYRSPLDTTAGAALLQGALKLTNTGKKPPQAYVMAVDVNGPVTDIVLKDNPAKAGYPVIASVTAVLADGESLALSEGGPQPLAEKSSGLESSRAIRLASAADEASSAVDALRKVLYTSQAHWDAGEHFTRDFPPGYEGPVVEFKGCKEAEAFTNLFAWNLVDMLGKTEGGRYRTSSVGAPNWGRYKGFGTWKDGVGWNQERAWSRDMGPTVIELAQLGYQARAEALCEYAWKWMGWFRDVDMRYPDGTPVPPHWIRSINTPEERSHNPVREGVQENDGHGLLMLATYKTWQRTADPGAWARRHWQGYKDAAEWICWQFEHPEISGATTVMRTVSECSRRPEKSPYAEFPCAMGLLGHAEIADSIGETTYALRWRTRANKMLAAMPEAYIVDDPVFGRRWDNAFAWSGHYPALGPLIDQADYNGLRPEQQLPEWNSVNLNTFQWQLHEHSGVPYAYHAAAFGYGQAFVTEAALLLDRMVEATALVTTMAKLAWFPGFRPWIVPEGVEWTDDLRYWFRTCDLGNGVQQANLIKTVRLMVGLDDSDGEHLDILPRLPEGFTQMHIGSYAVETSGGKCLVEMTYDRAGATGHSLDFSSERPVEVRTVRLGPLPAHTKLEQWQVTAQETTGSVSLGHEGAEDWMYFTPDGLVNRFKLTARILP